MEYKTPHVPQLNGVIDKRFAVIKEASLAMLLNAKLNDTVKKMLWEEAVHTCERVIQGWLLQVVRRACLKLSMEINRRLLVNYHSLDVSPMSLKGKILGNK